MGDGGDGSTEGDARWVFCKILGSAFGNGILGVLPDPEAVPFAFISCAWAPTSTARTLVAVLSCLTQGGFNPRRWRRVSGRRTTGAGAPGGACGLQISGRKPAEQKIIRWQPRKVQHPVCSGHDKLIPAGAEPSLLPAPGAAGSVCAVLFFFVIPGAFWPVCVPWKVSGCGVGDAMGGVGRARLLLASGALQNGSDNARSGEKNEYLRVPG